MRILVCTLATISLFCAIAQAAGNDGLVAHWDFEEGKGDILQDRSGQGNHGKIHGAKFVKLAKGHALQFDGVDDYVDGGEDASFNITDVISIEAWVHPDGVPASGEPKILSRWNPASYMLTYCSNGLCYWYINNGPNNCSAALSPNQWHHVVATFDRKALRLFVDGKLAGERASSYDYVASSTAPLLIGSYGQQAFFAGKLDEIKIHHRVLAADEVLKRYEASKAAYAADSPATAAATQAGPVAHYTFDEGSGNVVRDASGHGNHGKIHGAEFVKVSKGYALRFDGVDDYVDCGAGKAFDVRKAFTIEFWTKESGGVPLGEPGVMGKSSSSYIVTRCQNNIYVYKGGGPYNVNTQIMPRVWHHVVGTFQGNTLTLYLDGKLIVQRALKYPDVASQPQLPFRIGRLSDVRGAFKGLIDEVRFYDRPLTADEVSEHYRTTGRGLGLDARADFASTGEGLAVQTDMRNSGSIQEGGLLDVRVLAGTGIKARQRIAAPAGKPFIETYFDSTGWQPGDYTVKVSGVDATGRAAGSSATCAARIERPRFGPIDRGHRRLNNLVVQIIDRKGGSADRFTTQTFDLPRDGWVFISTTADVSGNGKLAVVLDSGGETDACITHTPGILETRETMRRLPKGRHTIALRKQGGCRVRRVILRTVPELAFAMFGHRSGKHDVEAYAQFLKRHVYPNVNLFLLHRPTRADMPTAREIIEEWRRDGRLFTSRCVTPWHAKLNPVTGDTVYDYFSKKAGFQHALLSGLYVDEIHGGVYSQTPAWLAALNRLRENPQFNGRRLFVYGTGLFMSEQSRQLMQKIMDCGYVFSWECYLHEQATEADAWFFLKQHLTANARAYNRTLPGSMGAITVNLGIFSDIGDSCDWYTDVNQKTYLDMMLNILANDPEFAGLHGVQLYAVIPDWFPEYFLYTDEETVRWASRLFRHYAIEGNTTMCSDDPYMMAHLKNGDFDKGTDAWDLSPAEPGSIEQVRFEGLHWIQGRWPYGGDVGDTVLMMRRSAERPNTISQPIRDLTPGRTYLLQMMSVDRENPKEERAHGLSIDIENVDFIPDKSTHRVRPNSHFTKEYPGGSLMLNCYRTVFHAKGKTAKLTISDWPGAKNPGGPIGQKLMFNFVQVQPYFED